MRRSYRQRLALWKSLMLHPGMDEYLLTLPEASRVVLHMHFEAGMPLHEIAAHLQVSLYITRHHHDYGLYLMKKNCEPCE